MPLSAPLSVAHPNEHREVLENVEGVPHGVKHQASQALHRDHHLVGAVTQLPAEINQATDASNSKRKEQDRAGLGHGMVVGTEG